MMRNMCNYAQTCLSHKHAPLIALTNRRLTQRDGGFFIKILKGEGKLLYVNNGTIQRNSVDSHI